MNHSELKQEIKERAEIASGVPEQQTVFDTDLLVVLEGMQLLDANQAERLRTCF